ncbi:chemotaxis protein CheA [bacterium]|nr:chemotaxis protein CheA [bacterium]
MDMSQYKDLFISEVRGHLRGMNETIVALEAAPGDREGINTLFRMAHSIKGMAASMGYGAMTDLAHKMEDLMDQVRKGVFVFDAGSADLLLEGADLLTEMVRDVEAGGTGERDIQDLTGRLAGYIPRSPGARPPGETEDETGEFSPTREGEEGTNPALRLDTTLAEGADSFQTIRVRTEVLDTLINITGELITNKNTLTNISREMNAPILEGALVDLSRHLRELHDEVLKVRLMPFSAIADRLPRTVRDLAKKSGKEVTFRVTGKEIELDRGILEELSDPLIHILRNAIDHGLEHPADRLAAGKPVAGEISVEVRREKGRVTVTVADDGRGMDPARLVAAAVEKRLVRREEGALLDPRQALMLICLPGFSTAREVTDVSGRGVGMDAVRASLQSLGGSLDIESEPGRGSRFILSLPMTISIIQVLLVACGSMVVAFPVTKVLRTVDLKREAIISRGRRKMFLLGEEEIPLMSLHRLLGFRLHPLKCPSVPAVVVEMKGRLVGLVVDRFAGQQDVFVKPLGRPLNRMRGLSGAAILGDGHVVFILDPANLV